jgi:hypothetical protein
MGFKKDYNNIFFNYGPPSISLCYIGFLRCKFVIRLYMLEILGLKVLIIQGWGFKARSFKVKD